MRKEKKIYFRARNDEYFMPDTQRQGWGQLTGPKTQLTQTESNGVRTRVRTGINA